MEKVTSPCLSNSGLTAVFNLLGTWGECKDAREAVRCSDVAIPETTTARDRQVPWMVPGAHNWSSPCLWKTSCVSWGKPRLCFFWPDQASSWGWNCRALGQLVSTSTRRWLSSSHPETSLHQHHKHLFLAQLQSPTTKSPSSMPFLGRITVS